MPEPDTNDPETIGLRALAWTLAEPARAARLLDTTGLSPQALRGAAGDRTTLAAVLGFLAAYEPDLVACADGIGVTPEALVRAHRALDA